MSGRKFQLYWVGAQREGSAEIGFPLFERRPQIKGECHPHCASWECAIQQAEFF